MELVLVVDDSAMDRHLAGGILQKTPGLTVEYAEDGEDALTKIVEYRPSLVLTDLVMPQMSGLELVDEVARRWPLMPVILMTGKGSEEIAVKALRAGAASYVPKAAFATNLAETVLNILALYQHKRWHSQLMGSLVRNDLTFDLGIDDDLIAPLVSHLQTVLTSTGISDEAGAFRACIALEEALRNAIFHGNLEISSKDREGDCDLYRQLLTDRRCSSPYRDRHLWVQATFTRGEAKFVIRDQGPGFDPRSLPDPTDPENLDKVSGRGVLLMRTFMDEVKFNERGNEVVMIKRSPTPAAVTAGSS